MVVYRYRVSRISVGPPDVGSTVVPMSLNITYDGPDGPVTTGAVEADLDLADPSDQVQPAMDTYATDHTLSPS